MKKIKNIFTATLIALALGSTTIANAETIKITGAGASFPASVYAKWSQSYKNATGILVNYQSIGSSSGVKEISANTVNFGASDTPLAADKLKQLGLVQFPTVVGAIVLIVNVDKKINDKIKLDYQTISDIYLNKIKYWNDPRIVALNPGLKLPKQQITAVYRADGSGTTHNFTTFLSQADENFKNEVGIGNSVSWKTGVGAKGNEGVSTFVSRARGSIGYVEYGFALKTKLSPLTLIDKEGNELKANEESVAKSISGADWNHPNFSPSLINVKAPGAWPLTTTTYILVRKDVDRKIANNVLDFFNYAYKEGNNDALALKYIPLPKEVLPKIYKLWNKEFGYKTSK